MQTNVAARWDRRLSTHHLGDRMYGVMKKYTNTAMFFANDNHFFYYMYFIALS